jgi:hypothetical protein
MLEYEVMRSPTSLRGLALFWSFSDLTQPYESLDSIYEKGLDVGWSTSTGYDGEIMTPNNRLEN